MENFFISQNVDESLVPDFVQLFTYLMYSNELENIKEVNNLTKKIIKKNLKNVDRFENNLDLLDLF